MEPIKRNPSIVRWMTICHFAATFGLHQSTHWLPDGIGYYAVVCVLWVLCFPITLLSILAFSAFLELDRIVPMGTVALSVAIGICLLSMLANSHLWGHTIEWLIRRRAMSRMGLKTVVSGKNS
jgi:hypothetical protein